MLHARRIETMEENRVQTDCRRTAGLRCERVCGASMDELTASVGLTRGALYHNFGDKKGLLAAVVPRSTARWRSACQRPESGRGRLGRASRMKGAAYIEMALDPEVQQDRAADGPAFSVIPPTGPARTLSANDKASGRQIDPRQGHGAD